MVSNDAGERRRVLISAYACGPVSEPEARAGWELARAAADENDVWVITRWRFRSAVEAELRREPALREHLRVDYLDLPTRLARLKRRPIDLYWYYVLWQRAAGRRARDLHARVGFDVAHHATFANDWMPSGLTALRDVPLVWGPVGGTSAVPVSRLARWLGARGVVIEIARGLLTNAARRISGDRVAQRAALVVAQNSDVAAHFSRRGSATTVEPNASLSNLPQRAPALAERTAVFAGRLIALKGATLALDAIARLAPAGWRLVVFGDGYQAGALRRRARRLGIADLVEFRGHRPRDEVLQAVAAAHVFLLPSMRDQAGWAVAEASSIGCPAVVLPLGGPPLLAEPNAHIASLEGDIVANVAAAILAAADAGGTPHDRWSIDRLPARVSRWYETAIERSAVSARARRRPLRVLESFREPQPTTNPYIVQLHRALTGLPGLRVSTFSHRRALRGGYDLVHLHWPELLVGGHTRRGRLARRALTLLLLLRWSALRTPLVRTVHNIERPRDISGVDGWILDRIDDRTCLDIHLNDHTAGRPPIPAVTIRHGDYRTWFDGFERADAVPGRIGYVGLIRRYKGVEHLIEAFSELDAKELTLHIAGRPSSEDLHRLLHRAARSDPRITVDPRFLDDREMVAAITSAELIVLPYRHMHNSGVVLAALSLARPVLVPDTAVNRALADEVGTGWVHLFRGDLTSQRILDAHRAASALDGEPDLSGRRWEEVGAAHESAFALAGGRRRGRPGPRFPRVR